MSFKNILLKNLARVLRILGILLVIYLSMVLYLKLSERHLAFPRASEHTEARAMLPKEAIKTCTLTDGTVLNGWILNENEKKTLLYFPDNGEDAATFLAEVLAIKKVRIISFNYRGSAGNKGKLNEETFESDAKGIWDCASDGGEIMLAGRGAGSIVALNLSQEKTITKLILMDPIPSIAAALTEKYGIFFPEFLVHTKVAMKKPTSQPKNGIEILEDKNEKKNLTKMTKEKYLTSAKTSNRLGKTLGAAVKGIIEL